MAIPKIFSDIENATNLATNALPKTGNAVSASKLAESKTIAISGGATGTATSFDGSGNITIPVTGLDMSKASGCLDVSCGGTGSTTQNFVDLSSAQTIEGVKTFSDGQKFVSVSGQSVNVSSLYSTTTGVVKHYWCDTDSGASNITGLPSKTAFVLISYTYRYVSASDCWIEQQLYQAGKSYRRTINNGSASGWVGMWII